MPNRWRNINTWSNQINRTSYSSLEKAFEKQIETIEELKIEEGKKEKQLMSMEKNKFKF